MSDTLQRLRRNHHFIRGKKAALKILFRWLRFSQNLKKNQQILKPEIHHLENMVKYTKLAHYSSLRD